MPEIPQSLGPSVRRAPLPTPLTNPGMASAAAFGAPIAEGAQRGADIAYRAKQQADDDRDTIEAMDGMNQFLVADHQKMTEYRSRTGANAKGLIDEAAVDYQKRQDEFEKQITSPRAKEKLRQMTAARWAQRNSGMLIEHQRDQMRAYEADTLGATIKNIHLDGLNDGTDDAIANAERMSALTYQRLADMQGADPQTRDLALRANAATLYGAAIEQDIDADNWQGAKARLDKFGDRIDKPQRDQLERKIREGGLNQRAQDTVDTMFKSGYAVTKADVDRMVSVEKDADLRQRIQIKADQEWNRREAAIAEARGATVKNLAAEIEKGADVEALLVKEENAAALEPQDKDHLRRIAADTAARRFPEPNGERWHALLRESALNPEAFIRRDLRVDIGKMSKGEWDQMARQQAAMLAGKLKGDDSDPIPRGIFSAQQIADDEFAKAFGMDPSDKGFDQDPRVKSFRRQYDSAILALGGKGKATDTQMRKAAADLLVKHRIETLSANPIRRLFGPTVTEQRRFELPGMAEAALAPDQVPRKYHDEMAADLAKEGSSVDQITPSEYMEIYRSMLERDALKAAERPQARTVEQIDPFQGGGL